MKRKNFIRHRPGGRMILPFCVAALVLAGCGSENDVNGNGTTAGRTPLQVTSGIQTMTMYGRRATPSGFSQCMEAVKA